MFRAYREKLLDECERLLLQTEEHCRTIAALLKTRQPLVKQLIFRGCRIAANELTLPHERSKQESKEEVARIRKALKNPAADVFDLEVLLRRAKSLCLATEERAYVLKQERLSLRATEEEVARLLISIKVSKLHDTIRAIQAHIRARGFIAREFVLVLTRIETELWSYGDEPPSTSFDALYTYEKIIDDLIFRANTLITLLEAQ